MKLIKPNALPTTLASFSRASTATYVDDAGVIQSAGVNVPRWERGQLLVEPAGTNLAQQSASPDTWVLSGLTLGSAVTAPDGSGTARQFLETTAAIAHQTNFGTLAFEAGKRYVFSVFAAEIPGGLKRYAAIFLTNTAFGATRSVCFDLATGAAGVPTGGVTEYGVERVNGGYRIWLAFVATATASAAQQLRSCTLINNASTVAAGDTSSGIVFWGRQVEQKDEGGPSSFVYTTTAAATRAADIITGSGVLQTTATDATAAWAAGTTYALDAQVQYNRSRYQSLQASNTGRQPDNNPTWWARLGPANNWAMFDDQVSTQTVQTTGPLRVALQTGAMDALAVLGVDADRVRLVVQDGAGGPVVYDQEQGMAAEAVTSWFDYFFNDPTYRRTQALFSGIPPFGSSVATLTFSSGSPVKVGHVSYGRLRSLGGLRYGARAGIKDFSRKDTDDFGVTTFVRRANSKYLTGTLEVEKPAINQVHNLLTSLTATPVVWIGSDDVYYSDTLLVFGFFRDFYASIDYPMLSIYSLEIEGLI